jgi:ADP-heptose:LPS heptosyltransferase
MALPAVADVQAGTADAAIDIAARAPIAPLVPLVEGIGTRCFSAAPRSIDVLKAGGYDSALLLPNSFNTAWIARQAAVAERWGYRNEFRSILLTRALRRRRACTRRRSTST